jgi:rubrerythrin
LGKRKTRGVNATIITDKRRKYMLSQTPLRLDKVRKEDIDKEILRAAIIAALDAVNLYEQMAALTENKHIKTALLDIAREEKAYVEQFQTLRNRLLLRENSWLLNGVSEMVVNVPIILDDAPAGDADKDVLRAAIITALEALHCYQKMACMAGDERIREILMEGVREEKGRMRELGTILLRGRDHTGNGYTSGKHNRGS